MKITLFSNNLELCDCWREDFRNELNVTVIYDEYKNIPQHDCIVSPANSYGIMNGGLDLHIRNELGIEVQDGIQWTINQKFGGCQPIGTCFVLATGKERFKHIAHAPTMQIPKNIDGTLNPMHSFYAAISEISKIKEIDSVACSGMGAGVGGINPKEVSRQMYEAYKMIYQS